MEEYYYLTPVLGGLIGYATNWLAIKMVFRPYNEVRILGVRVPFTPGIMAKEKPVLAKKIGETVAEHLITDDIIKEKIQNIQYNDMINKSINNMKSGLAVENQTVEQYIEKNNFGSGDFGKKLEALIDDEIKKIVNDENIKNDIVEMMSNKTVEIIGEYTLGDIIPQQTYQKICTSIIDIIETEEVQNTINVKKDEIYNSLVTNEKSIGELVGELDVEKIKKITSEVTPVVAVALAEFVNSDKFDSVDVEIKAIVKKVIENNFGKFVSGFINVENVVNNSKTKFFEYVNTSEGKEELCNYSERVVEHILSLQVDEVAQKMPKNMYDSTVEKVIEVVKVNMGDVIENVMERFDKNLRIKDIVGTIVSVEEQKKMVGGIVDKAIVTIGSDDEIVNYISKAVVSGIGNVKTSVVADVIDDDVVDSISEVVNSKIDEMSGDIIDKVINNINISEIVEDRINDFELDEAEELVMFVMKKEFNSITMLGGILGFIIGLVPMIFK